MNTKQKIGIGGLAASVFGVVLMAGSPTFAASYGPANPPTTQPAASAHKHHKKSDAAKAGLLLRGNVTQANGRSLVIANAQHEGSDALNIVTDDNTAFYAFDGSSATLANIKTSTTVLVLLNQARNSAGPLSAKAISILPAVPAIGQTQSAKKAEKLVMVGGQVSAISSSGFTLTGKKRTDVISGTINIISTTQVIVPGKTSATFNDIAVGEHVAVFGPKPADKTSKLLNATLIVVQPDTADEKFGGLLAAVSGNTLVLFTRTGEVLKVDTSSAVIKPHVVGATISDLKPGHALGVIGTLNSDGTITAQVVGELHRKHKARPQP